MIAPFKQLCPQLLLQILKLAGQGWLGHVEKLGCVGDVFLPGSHQKIPKHAQFHNQVPFRIG